RIRAGQRPNCAELPGNCPNGRLRWVGYKTGREARVKDNGAVWVTGAYLVLFDRWFLPFYLLLARSGD
ncbi:MAG: hypothetical protein RLZZ170_902, partial [Actinomycetota bacterium]